jgi:predicted CXXCH cytochrome family protein
MRQAFLTFGMLLAGVAFASTAVEWDPAAQEAKVQQTPHNMTHWHGEAAAGDDSAERLLCRVCHGPSVHEELRPLWDRELPRGAFEMGAVLDADEPGFPADPSSQLCLACHDGGVARAFPADPAEHIDLEVELGERQHVAPTHMNTHLFSFDSHNSELRQPDSLATGMTVQRNRMRCSTCHDAHNNEHGSFLRVPAESGAICLECHEMDGWQHSVHANPDDPLLMEMEEMACAQCHSIHASPPQPSLLLADQNTLCFRCHDGSQDSEHEVPAASNLKQEFSKQFTHPVGFHAGSEAMVPDESGFVGFLAGSRENRAVSCSDCHNPHAVASESMDRSLPASLEGVRGVSRLGLMKERADFEYEICLKCHGYSATALPGQRDVAADFDLSNRSSHAVMGPGTSVDVPSLKEGWNPLDQLTCSDCHGSDDEHGPAGPHGSKFEFLLKRPWNTSPFTVDGFESDESLCFMCHDEEVINGGDSWRWHNLHTGQGGYSCAACHDPHGSKDGPGLINLDLPWIAEEDDLGAPEKKIERSALDVGTCTLKCHDHPHRNSQY